MKTNATIHGVRLKNEVKRRKGEIVSSDVFWLVTVKIPARRIDANEIPKNIDDVMNFALEAVQTRINFGDDLPGATVSKGESGSVTITVPSDDPADNRPKAPAKPKPSAKKKRAK